MAARRGLGDFRDLLAIADLEPRDLGRHGVEIETVLLGPQRRFVVAIRDLAEIAQRVGEVTPQRRAAIEAVEQRRERRVGRHPDEAARLRQYRARLLALRRKTGSLARAFRHGLTAVRALVPGAPRRRKPRRDLAQGLGGRPAREIGRRCVDQRRDIVIEGRKVPLDGGYAVALVIVAMPERRHALPHRQRRLRLGERRIRPQADGEHGCGPRCLVLLYLRLRPGTLGLGPRDRLCA